MMRLSGPVRPFVLGLLGVLGLAAIAVAIAGLANGGALLMFAVFYVFAVGVERVLVGLADTDRDRKQADGNLALRSAIGRVRVLERDDMRALCMSKLMMVPKLKLRHGSVWLLPVAPVGQLARYLDQSRPDVEVALPERARWDPGWPRRRG